MSKRTHDLHPCPCHSGEQRTQRHRVISEGVYECLGCGRIRRRRPSERRQNGAASC